jgi:hypothetical protein
VARGNKGQDPGPAEKWAPGRTLYSVTEIRLTAEDMAEAEPLISASNEQIRVELAEEFRSIATRYWEQHRDAKRPPADWYRTKVGRVQKEAENLLKRLREPLGTAAVQLKFRTEQQMGLRLLGSRQEAPSIEQLLDDFVGVCKSCTFPSARGAPNKAHIKTAVASLREVWIKFTGKEFPLNLESADNRRDHDGRPAAVQDRDEVLTSPGPRFVQVMMRRIDPNVRIGAIRTALRDASVNGRSVD